MNSIQRTLCTLEHKTPDRVPVDLHNFMVTARMMGVTSYADFFRDGAALDGAALPVPLSSSRANVAALVALYESARKGVPVTVARV